MTRAIDHSFTRETPLGPATTPTDFLKGEHSAEFSAFFDRDNFLSKELLRSQPNAILGRRGSGKTAFLCHLLFHGGYDVVVKIESGNAFAHVADQITKSLGHNQSKQRELVEVVAEIWKTVLLTTVICNVHSKFKSLDQAKTAVCFNEIDSFVRANGLVNLSLYSTVWRALVRIFEQAAKVNYNLGDGSSTITDFLDGRFRSHHRFDAAWDATVTFLDMIDAKAIVLIDSLEQFPIHEWQMQRALSGLLHLVGELDRSPLPVKVCMCFPAELHQELVTASFNPEKDFERVLVLHWDSKELFQLCARRFDTFLNRILNRNVWSHKTLPDRPERDEVWSYWHQFFPVEVHNRGGYRENTIAYISRHTQMLPRHLLHIMNKIIMLSFKRADFSLPFHEEDIVDGVRLGRKSVCDGVLNGFRQKFPLASQLCKTLIPHLGNHFRYEDLSRFNKLKGESVVKDAGDVLEMFIRMGIIGVVQPSDSAYLTCQFDYTYNGEMPYTADDLFGLHPAFAGQFRSRGLRRDGQASGAIYPIEEFNGGRFGVQSFGGD